MKKKLIVVMLALALVLSAVSAKDVPFAVGAQLGWGFDTLYGRSKGTSGDTIVVDSTRKYANNGVALNVIGEYELSDSFAIRANLGMMYAGKATYTLTDNKNQKDNTSSTYSEKSGLYFDVAAGLKYKVDFSKTLSLSGIAGVELLSGKLYKTGNTDTDNKAKNLAFGLNLALEVSYKINKNFYLNGGVSSSWFMINNTEAISSQESSVGSYKYTRKINSLYFRPYAGMTYAF